MSHRGSGVTLALLSAATFSTSGTFASALIGAGWSPGAAVTARVVIAALVLTPSALHQLRGHWSQLRRASGLVGAYGLVAVAGCQLCYFNAIAHLSIGVALLLEYMGTILVIGWLWLRHGQRPRRLTVAGGGTAILGLVLVLDLLGSQRLDPVGMLWGLGGAVGLAVFFVLSASIEQPLPPLVLAWGGLSVGAVVLAAFAVIGVMPVRAPLRPVDLFDHRMSWLVPVLGLALVAAAFAYVAGIGAARLLGPKLATFFGLTEVVFGVLVAWLLLSQVPSALQLGGGVLILTGVALVRLDELRTPPPTRVQLVSTTRAEAIRGISERAVTSNG